MSGSRLTAELRRSFDEIFARPRPERGGALEDLLAIRVGAHPYALRLAELRGLERTPKLTPLPAAAAELLGLAAIRGRLVTVFSLAALLGYGATRDGHGWLALCERGELVGLAFDGFEGHRRVAATAIHPAAEGARREHLTQVLSLTEGSRPLVDTLSIVNVLRARAGLR